MSTRRKPSSGDPRDHRGNDEMLVLCPSPEPRAHLQGPLGPGVTPPRPPSKSAPSTVGKLVGDDIRVTDGMARSCPNPASRPDGYCRISRR